MDPISAFGLAAGILQLIGISAKVGMHLQHTIHNFRHAAVEISALSNEVSDLRLVLSEVDVTSLAAHDKQEAEAQHHESAEGESPGPESSIKIAVRRASAILEQIQNYLTRLEKDTGILKILRPNHARWVAARSGMKALQEALRDQKLAIIMALNLGTRNDLLRIDIEIKEILLITKNTATQQQEYFVQTANELANQKAQLDRIYARSLQLDPSQFIRRVTQDTLSGMMRLKDDGLHLPTPAGELYKVEDSAATIAFGVANRKRKSCPVTCTCQCHLESTIHTPDFLQNLFGRLFIGYAGLPVYNVRCDVVTCKQKPAFKARLVYNFPSWFILRLISVMATVTQSPAGLGALIEAKRIIPHNSSAIHMSAIGDLPGLRHLFASGKGSPNDTEGIGVTFNLLFQAIARRNVATCQFLLDSGADPTAEDELGYSAVDHAWTAILGKSLDPQVLEYFRSAFLSHDGGQFAKRRFNILHSIVLGLAGRNRSLREELELTTVNINTVDGLFRTPLSWAVERGQIDHVRVLLEFGADPNIQDYRGNTVLDYCGSSLNENAFEISQLLLAHGADPYIQNKWGLNFLLVIASFQTSAHWLEPLYAHPDFDIDFYIPEVRATALEFTVAKDLMSLFQSLVNHGADIEFRNGIGYTALMLTIYHDRPDMVAYLLAMEPAPDTLAVSRHGDNIVHVAAQRSGPDTMRILAMANVTDIDIDAKNKAGFTAEDLLRQRFSIQPGLLEAFIDLKKSLEEHKDDNQLENFFLLDQSLPRKQTSDSMALYYDAHSSLPYEESALEIRVAPMKHDEPVEAEETHHRAPADVTSLSHEPDIRPLEAGSSETELYD